MANPYSLRTVCNRAYNSCLVKRGYGNSFGQVNLTFSKKKVIEERMSGKQICETGQEREAQGKVAEASHSQWDLDSVSGWWKRNLLL